MTGLVERTEDGSRQVVLVPLDSDTPLTPGVEAQGASARFWFRPANADCTEEPQLCVAAGALLGGLCLCHGASAYEQPVRNRQIGGGHLVEGAVDAVGQALQGTLGDLPFVG